MRKYFWPAVLALTMILLLSGCGGDQNVLQVANQVPPFGDGFWDGFTVIVNVFAGAFEELIGNQNYAVIDEQAARGRGDYLLGYVAGFATFAFLFVYRRIF